MAAEAGTNAFVAVPIAVLLEWQEQLHAAFELGVKSAGGSIIPDRSKFVEIALDRQTLNALADVAEYICSPSGEVFVGDAFEKDRVALKQFLEIISIYRSPKMRTYSMVAMQPLNSTEFVAAMKPGQDVTLVREPTNRFDVNAIMVWTEDPHVGWVHIGYLPKKQNVALAGFIDQTGTPVAGAEGNDMIVLALDASAQAAGTPRGLNPRFIPAKFVRSPNSGYPMVEVSE